MSIHLVTGYAGREHITSADQGSFNANVMGSGEFVLEGGEQFKCQVISNNKVRIYDGEALMQGRHIKVERNTYEETTHDNGTQGYQRIDLIVLTYTKNATTGIEGVTLDVIKGTPAENNPAVPEYVKGDILNLGDLQNQMPLYKIPFDGLSIGEPVAMFETVPTLAAMKEDVDAHVEDKMTEIDEHLAEFEEEIDKKIADAGKPLVSDLDAMTLIDEYGKYAADAKTVGEEITALKKSVSDGKLLVANAITEHLEVETATDASFETIANNILNSNTVSKEGLNTIYDLTKMLSASFYTFSLNDIVYEGDFDYIKTITWKCNKGLGFALAFLDNNDNVICKTDEAPNYNNIVYDLKTARGDKTVNKMQVVSVQPAGTRYLSLIDFEVDA